MSADRSSVHDHLVELLNQRLLLLDGAAGTTIFAMGLDEETIRGERFRDHDRDLKNFVDLIALTHPDRLVEMHCQFLEAGSDIIETNTFGSSPVGLAEFGLGELVEEINIRAVECAREAADLYHRKTPDKPRTILYKNPLPSTLIFNRLPRRRTSKRQMVLTGFSEEGHPREAPKELKSCFPSM